MNKPHPPPAPTAPRVPRDAAAGVAARPEVPGAETNRLEALSDGVFAVAITLLALELKVPPVHEGG